MTPIHRCTLLLLQDPTFKNILNFNVGQTVDLEVPRVSVAVRERAYLSTAVWGCVVCSVDCSGGAQ